MSKIDHLNDSDTGAFVHALLNDAAFRKAIRCLQFPRWPELLHKPLEQWIYWQLCRRLAKVQSVDKFQSQMFFYLEHMVKASTTLTTSAGLHILDKQQAYLFVSNHRDITLDPAFINYFLYQQWDKSVRIGVGDNLLDQSFVSKLMLLNKSFSIKRMEVLPRKRLANMHSLAQFIADSIQHEQHSVWIAQRNGRAKDGIDKTDPALIKMLSIHHRHQFSEYIKQLNIVPVAISYEYDPCDILKAQELYTLECTGQYQKSENEDLHSMVQGIMGFKGDVHVHFGQPLTTVYPDAAAVAAAIDEQVIGSYKLHASHIFAYQKLYAHSTELGKLEKVLSLTPQQWRDKRAYFDRRFNTVPEHLQAHWLAMYANPVGAFLSC